MPDMGHPRLRLWGVGALLLAIGAGVGFYQIVWKVYHGQITDYGVLPYTAGALESSFLYWFAGLGLLATIGLTVGLALLLPPALTVPDWSRALILLAVALALAVRFLILQQSPTVDEENVYRFTAQLLTHGRLALHTDLPAELLGSRWGWFRTGQDWAGIYPYGWPFLLAIGSLVRLPWL